MMNTREALLARLDETVSNLLTICATIPAPDLHVDENWTIRDVMCHLTFWHENFARNVHDLVHGVKPTPLKGRLIDLNQRSIDEFEQCSLQDILGRFVTAHATIQEHILNPAFTLIPYRKGSRDYTPEEHLQVVDDHIAAHMKRVSKTVQQTR